VTVPPDNLGALLASVGRLDPTAAAARRIAALLGGPADVGTPTGPSPIPSPSRLQIPPVPFRSPLSDEIEVQRPSTPAGRWARRLATAGSIVVVLIALVRAVWPPLAAAMGRLPAAVVLVVALPVLVLSVLWVTNELAAANRGEAPTRVDDLGREALGPGPAAVPSTTGTVPPGSAAPEPLLPPALARSSLLALATSRTPHGPIDLDRVVRAVVAGSGVTSVPRRWRRTTGRGLQLVIERRSGMLPFVHDVRRLEQGLADLLPGNGLRVIEFDGSPAELAPDDPALEHDERFIEPGTRVALVGSLGVGRGARDAFEWRDLVSRLRLRGCPTILLAPVGEARQPEVVRDLPVVVWDRGPDVGALDDAWARAR
jgi:hypothetical protein